MKLRSLILVIIAALVWTSGCANKNPQSSSPNAPAASNFEKSRDPAINARTRFAAAQLAESQGEFSRAIEQYQKALELNPKYAEAMFRLGIVQTTTRDFGKAIETWNRYVALANGSATAYSNLGFCQELAGNPAAAEGAYRAGINHEPSNEPCHVNYGLMLARHGRPNEGLLQLQMVLPPAKAHYDLASVYETMGRKKEARTEYARALELDPTFGDAKSKIASLEGL